jgi:hypothetical protein
MTILRAAGWEVGDIDGIDWVTLGGGVGNGTVIITGTPHTGSYSLRLYGGQNPTFRTYRYAYIAFTAQSEVYVSFWIHPSTCYNQNQLGKILLGAAITLDLEYTHWDLHGPAGTTVGTRTISSGWHHIQIHLIKHATDGIFTTHINGIQDINFTGNTGAGTVNYLGLFCDSGGSKQHSYLYLDDMVIQTGDWPGDVRIEPLLLNGDDAVQWTRSAGGDNYALVDEVPPSDADYVYSETDGHKDLYTLADFDTADKTPVFVVQWCRAKKDEAAAHQAKLVLDDGTESVGDAEDLDTSYVSLQRIHETKPSGGVWTDAALDALKTGAIATII